MLKMPYRRGDLLVQNDAGFSLIEILISVGLFCIVALGISSVYTNLTSYSSSQQAKSASIETTALLERQLTKAFAIETAYNVSPDTLAITHLGPTSNYAITYQIVFQTTCTAIPAGNGLIPSQRQALALLAPCHQCPDGQMPSVQVNDQETGTSKNYPPPSSGSGLMQKALAAAICPLDLGGSVQVKLISATLRSDKTVLPTNRQVILSTSSQGSSDVQILH